MPYADPVKRREKQIEYDRRHRKKIGPEGVRAQNARSYKSSGRNSHLRRTYGLTESEVESLKQKQAGKCAICAKELTGRFCVDHCHGTGKVRGLLCHRCNSCLAAVEQLGWLEAVKEYLKKHTIC